MKSSRDLMYSLSFFLLDSTSVIRVWQSTNAGHLNQGAGAGRRTGEWTDSDAEITTDNSSVKSRETVGRPKRNENL